RLYYVRCPSLCRLCFIDLVLRMSHERAHVFFFIVTATTEIYTLSLHDALPICDLAAGAPAPVEESDSAAKIVELQRQQVAKPLVDETPTPQPASQAAPRTQAPQQQETIRVSAPLLDDLVNLAGETSIARSRLEQQISDFSHTLE